MDWQHPFVGFEDAALIAQLQREDVEALMHVTTGKQREGDLTDAELALQLCLEDLEIFDLNHADHQMACSLGTAIISDCSIIAEALEQEAQVTRDRELAMRLQGTDDSGVGIDGGSDPCHPSDTDGLDEVARAKVQARCFADLYGLRNPLWSVGSKPKAESSKWAASRKPDHLHDTSACVACSEDKPWFDTVVVPCGDVYCCDCLTSLLEASMTDESLYPPRCCRQVIPFPQVKVFLSPAVMGAFAEKSEELDTRNRVYCFARSCSAFIPPRNIAHDVATCPSCSRSTCVICKNAEHLGDCPEDVALNELVEKANEEGWQRCYSCRRMVELEIGCNHITCICRAEFCYVCGAQWKTCNCEQWEERRLMARAERIALRGDNQNRRLHQPAVGPRHEEAALLEHPGLNDWIAIADVAPDVGDVGQAVVPANHADQGPEEVNNDDRYENHRDDDEEEVPPAADDYVPLRRPPALLLPPRGLDPRSRRTIEQIAQNLRDNHECDHERWKWVRGPHVCEECHHRLPRYIFECRQCELQACNRCKKNRL